MQKWYIKVEKTKTSIPWNRLRKGQAAFSSLATSSIVGRDMVEMDR